LCFIDLREGGHDRDLAEGCMNRVTIALALVVCLAPHVFAQRMATTAKLTLLQSATEPLAFSNPAVPLKGTIRPVPGDRLQVVVITLGDAPIEAEVRQFTLVAVGGATYEPIAVGGGADLIFPLDRLSLGQEMGQLLPSDASIAVKRVSRTSVTIEADSGATLAFVYEVPERSTVRVLRLPDGSELALSR
jgi:hypothetical protein